MPRFITVTLGCDWPECDIEGYEGDEAVVQKSISIDNKQARIFLICKNHLDVLEETLLPLMQNGTKADTPKKTRSTTSTPTPSVNPVVTGVECKACGRTDLKNTTGLAQHVQRSHDFESYTAYKKAYNITD